MKLYFFNLLCITLSVLTAQSSWPEEFKEEHVQTDFEAGVVPEIQALWFGDEKYKNAKTGELENFCSRFNVNPKGYLVWDSVWNKTCKDVGVIYKKGKVKKGNWLQQIDLPGYIMRFRQKHCLPDCECDEDVTKDSDLDDTVQFEGYTLEAKACGAHLMDDFMSENNYFCEVYQTSLISKTDKETGEKKYLIVVVLSYRNFDNGWDNYDCPSKPSFLAENIAAPGEGSARFVLQVPYNETIYDPCTWECFDGKDGCGKSTKKPKKPKKPKKKKPKTKKPKTKKPKTKKPKTKKPTKKPKTKITNSNMQTCVDEWVTDATKAEEKYGHIDSWDVSRVTYMVDLFRYAESFNADISKWDVSGVTNMATMFFLAESFNENISPWNVSAVTDMAGMFASAASFNVDISDWNISAVTDMRLMFGEAESFDKKLCWDISGVDHTTNMFLDSPGSIHPDSPNC